MNATFFFSLMNIRCFVVIFFCCCCLLGSLLEVGNQVVTLFLLLEPGEDLYKIEGREKKTFGGKPIVRTSKADFRKPESFCWARKKRKKKKEELAIFVPGIYFLGLMRYSDKFASVQVTPESLLAEV